MGGGGSRGAWSASSPWEPSSKLSIPPLDPHRWFCHVDDDNYVNPRALLKLLKTFPQTRDVYLGRPSLNRPIRASEPRPHNRTVGPSLPPCAAEATGVGCGQAGGRGDGAGRGRARSPWYRHVVVYQPFKCPAPLGQLVDCAARSP